MKPITNLMLNAARKAGHVIIRHIPKIDRLNVETKGLHDYVSEVDKMAEKEIIYELKRAYPDYAIIGEESGSHGENRFAFVIDPLDGTSNYLRGIPHYCVSIALCENLQPVAGLIYDPVNDEVFSATKGAGAYLNERRIRASGRERLNSALLATGFAPRVRDQLNNHLTALAPILENAEDLRRTGSAALDLCYVAAGRLDGYFEAGTKAWDVAAGMLIASEAGAVCTDFQGRTLELDAGSVVCAQYKLAKEISGMLTEAGFKPPKQPIA